MYAAFGPGRKCLAYYLRRRAYAYQQSRDWVHTERTARLSLALVPNDVYTLTMLGAALEMLEHYDEMEPVYRRAVALAPNSAQAMDGLGSALSFQGHYAEAEECLRKAVKLDPSIPEVQNDFGTSLYELGRFDEAEVQYREAIRLRPDYGTPHGGLGEILLQLGKVKEAEAEFREAVRLSPQRFKSHNGLGLFLLKVDRLDEAEAEFQNALRLQPGSADVRCNLGELYWKQGKFVEAESQYRDAFRLAHGLPRAAKQLALFLIEAKGRHQFSEGKLRDAEETLREAVGLTPNSAFAYNNLGTMLTADSNRWTEAEELIKKSVDLASAEEKPLCLDSLGQFLAKQPQRRAEAVTVYREVLAEYSTAGRTDDVNRVRDILNHLETQ